METLGWFVVGSFAAWIITFSIAISHDMEGPFHIYTLSRIDRKKKRNQQGGVQPGGEGEGERGR